MRLIVRYFLRITLFAMLVVGWGCSADFEPIVDASPNPDDSYWGDYITALGWIEEAEDLNREMCAITTDEGFRLSVVELGGSLTADELPVGRAMFNYTILGTRSDVPNAFWVRLNRLYSLAVKPMEVYDRGDALSAGYECLGAPAMPYQVSIGGGCVNINVLYSAYQQPSEALPNVTLHYDLKSSTIDTSIFQLEYVEGAEVEGGGRYDRYQWFSFVVPEEYAATIESGWTYAFQWRWWRAGEYGNHEAGYIDQTSVVNTNSWGGSDR